MGSASEDSGLSDLKKNIDFLMLVWCCFVFYSVFDVERFPHGSLSNRLVCFYGTNGYLPMYEGGDPGTTFRFGGVIGSPPIV